MKLNIFDKIFKTKDWYAANKESKYIEHEHSLGFSAFCKNDKLPQRDIKRLEYICNNKDRIIEIDICENYKNIQKKYKLGVNYYLNEINQCQKIPDNCKQVKNGIALSGLYPPFSIAFINSLLPFFL